MINEKISWPGRNTTMLQYYLHCCAHCETKPDQKTFYGFCDNWQLTEDQVFKATDASIRHTIESLAKYGEPED
ncbi:hypothetical protein C5Y96_17040 [Blastopirellula marina]|uniref:Uncharacterized protein n=1 Tax=Blastopirellula marina TaxID=124 RepID=A0A2S8F7E6_9BACT|nr:hypothetical protein C5Y96_17040 [Blastopirellula marina]RCS48502.1 hypothetical protein DTL36_17060 [Bremerella cremea]